MKREALIMFLSRTFGKGLAIVLPVLIATYLIAWAVGDFDKAIRTSLEYVLPEFIQLPPGLGLFVFLSTTFLVGLLMYPWMTRKALLGADSMFRRVPIFRTIYSPVKDLFNMFGQDISRQLGEVVMLKVPGTDMETLGFVTKRGNEGLPDGFVPEGYVVVYVQWSSQIGGYCFLIPEKDIRPIALTVEEGMRWALTAGLSTPVSASTVLERSQQQSIAEEIQEQAFPERK